MSLMTRISTVALALCCTAGSGFIIFIEFANERLKAHRRVEALMEMRQATFDPPASAA